jgi:hypothetical protein
MPRHPLPEIGSPSWDRQLARLLGLRRAWVDELLDLATQGRPPETIDPHELWRDVQRVDASSLRSWQASRSPALSATSPDDDLALWLAAGVLLHQRAPGYGLLMNLGLQLMEAGYEGPPGGGSPGSSRR